MKLTKEQIKILQLIKKWAINDQEFDINKDDNIQDKKFLDMIKYKILNKLANYNSVEKLNQYYAEDQENSSESQVIIFTTIVQIEVQGQIYHIGYNWVQILLDDLDYQKIIDDIDPIKSLKLYEPMKRTTVHYIIKE